MKEVLAAPINNPVLGPGLQSILQGSDPGETFFQRLLTLLVNLFLAGGSIVFFFMLITGAIAWISSGGDSKSIESARNRVTHALIGIFILFSTYAIIKAIEGFFGISILVLDIGNLSVR
jgi:hypothetical protein